MDKNRKGILDLMDTQRFRPTDLRKALIENEVPGNWEGKNGLQNVYNLINANVVPRDAFVFVFLSEFLQVKLKDVLMRYTVKYDEDKVDTYNGDKIFW